jgi:glycosyltransferase involved in cell wall biosynthesis
VPLIFDPLISAYDKQVDERRKFSADSSQARRLLQWERGLFSRADRVVADTRAHADYFQQVLGVPEERIAVLMVGAEEELFKPCPPRKPNESIEVLFFGSFIPLQGPEVIVEAARLCTARNVTWTLLGDGPLRLSCEQSARGLTNVRFEKWLPYRQLPERICRADILLGIFGDTPKAGRVIPNKVYQALACAKPLVTRSAPAYPQDLQDEPRSGIRWVPAADPQALAGVVERLASEPHGLPQLGTAAGRASEHWFSNKLLADQLQSLLDGCV